MYFFFGYNHEEEFGYRFWDPVYKKVIRSKDAVVLENQTIANFDKLEKPNSSKEELFIRSWFVHLWCQ